MVAMFRSCNVALDVTGLDSAALTRGTMTWPGAACDEFFPRGQPFREAEPALIALRDALPAT